MVRTARRIRERRKVNIGALGRTVTRRSEAGARKLTRVEIRRSFSDSKDGRGDRLEPEAEEKAQGASNCGI
jgi:hypothetical protein